MSFLSDEELDDVPRAPRQYRASEALSGNKPLKTIRVSETFGPEPLSGGYIEVICPGQRQQPRLRRFFVIGQMTTGDRIGQCRYKAARD